MQQDISMLFFPGCASVKPQGRGVVLILGSEKNPVGSVLCPIVGALAAGNALIARIPASRSKCEKVLETFFKTYLDDRFSILVHGASSSAESLAHLSFDAVCFTGTEEEARNISRAASDHLNPLFLNLEKASVMVVDSSAHLESAASK